MSRSEGVPVSHIELNLPEALGRVENTQLPIANKPVLFHIQTAHGDAQTQVKVKEILNHLRDSLGTTLVFAEGASEKLRPELLKFFPDPASNSKMAELLLQKGLYTGIDLFLLSNGTEKKIEVTGIEIPRLYRAAYHTFKEVFQNSNASDSWLREKELKLDREAHPVLSKELMELVKQNQRFQDHKLSFLNYSNFLSRLAGKILGFDFKSPYLQLDWPQLVRLILIQDLQKSLDQEKLAEEKQKVGIKPEADSEIEKDPRLYFEKFLKENQPKGFRFNDYPHFTHWMGVLILQHELDGKALMGELQKLDGLLKQSIVRSDREREILKAYEELSLLKKLLRLELTCEEWNQIKAVSVKRQAISNASLRFYKLVERRDFVFFEKIQRGLETRKIKKAALVTGGFHTEGLTSLFKEHGFGYAVITPRMNGEVDSDIYRQVMINLAQVEKVQVPQSRLTKEKMGLNVRAEARMIQEAFREVASQEGISVTESWFKTPYAQEMHAETKRGQTPFALSRAEVPSARMELRAPPHSPSTARAEAREKPSRSRLTYQLKLEPGIREMLGPNMDKLIAVIEGKIKPDRVYGRRSYLRLNAKGTPASIRRKVLVMKGFTEKIHKIQKGKERIVRHSGKGRTPILFLVDKKGKRFTMPSYEGHAEGTLGAKYAGAENRINRKLFTQDPDISVIPAGTIEFYHTRLRYQGEEMGVVMMIVDDLQDLRVAHLTNQLAEAKFNEGGFTRQKDKELASQTRSLILRSAFALGRLHHHGIIHRFFHLGNVGVGKTHIQVRDLDQALHAHQLTKDQFIEWAVLDFEYFLKKVEQDFLNRTDFVHYVLGKQWKKILLRSYLSGLSTQFDSQKPILRSAIQKASQRLKFGRGISFKSQRSNPLLGEVFAQPRLPNDLIVPDPIVPYTKQLKTLSPDDRAIANGDYETVVQRYDQNKKIPKEPRDLYNLIISLLVVKRDREARNLFNASTGKLKELEKETYSTQPKKSRRAEVRAKNDEKLSENGDFFVGDNRLGRFRQLKPALQRQLHRTSKFLTSSTPLAFQQIGEYDRQHERRYARQKDASTERLRPQGERNDKAGQYRRVSARTKFNQIFSALRRDLKLKWVQSLISPSISNQGRKSQATQRRPPTVRDRINFLVGLVYQSTSLTRLWLNLVQPNAMYNRQNQPSASSLLVRDLISSSIVASLWSAGEHSASVNFSQLKYIYNENKEIGPFRGYGRPEVRGQSPAPKPKWTPEEIQNFLKGLSEANLNKFIQIADDPEMKAREKREKLGKWKSLVQSLSLSGWVETLKEEDVEKVSQLILEFATNGLSGGEVPVESELAGLNVDLPTTLIQIFRFSKDLVNSDKADFEEILVQVFIEQISSIKKWDVDRIAGIYVALKKKHNFSVPEQATEPLPGVLWPELRELKLYPLPRVNAFLPLDPEALWTPSQARLLEMIGEERWLPFPTTPKNGETLPEKIKRLQKITGATNKEVIARVKVTRETYRKNKSGKHPPLPSTLEGIVDYYASLHRLSPRSTREFFGLKRYEDQLNTLFGKPRHEIIQGIRESIPVLSQETFAKAFGMVRKSYQQWEDGTVNPPIASLHRLIQYYVSEHLLTRPILFKLLGFKTQDAILSGAPQKDFSELLIELRNFAGLFQGQVSKAIGISETTYANWEVGGRPVHRHLPAVDKMAQFYAKRGFPEETLRNLLREKASKYPRREALEALLHKYLANINRIAKELEVGDSTVSRWVRDLNLTEVAESIRRETEGLLKGKLSARKWKAPQPLPPDQQGQVPEIEWNFKINQEEKVAAIGEVIRLLQHFNNRRFIPMSLVARGLRIPYTSLHVYLVRNLKKSPLELDMVPPELTDQKTITKVLDAVTQDMRSRTSPHEILLRMDVEEYLGNAQGTLLTASRRYFPGVIPAVNLAERFGIFSAYESDDTKNIRIKWATEFLKENHIRETNQSHYAAMKITSRKSNKSKKSPIRAETRVEFALGRGKAGMMSREMGKTSSRMKKEDLEPVVGEIRDRVLKMDEGEPKKMASRILQHIESLINHKKGIQISVFNEFRWTSESYLLASATPQQIYLGRGLFMNPSEIDDDFKILGSQMLFLAGAKSLSLVHQKELNLKDPKFLDELQQSVFGEDREKFWKLHQEFINLSQFKFFYSAVNRFEGFTAENARTQQLVQRWVEHELKKAPEDLEESFPVLLQAGALARAALEYASKMKKGELTPEAEAENKFIETSLVGVLFPLLAFSLYRYSLFRHLSSMRSFARETITNKVKALMEAGEFDFLKKKGMGPKLAPKGKDATLDNLVKLALKDKLEKGEIRPFFPEQDILNMAIPEKVSLDAIKRFETSINQLTSRMFRAPEDWQLARIDRYFQQLGKEFIVPGLGKKASEWALKVADVASGYVVETTKLVAHSSSIGTTQNWPAFSHFIETNFDENKNPVSDRHEGWITFMVLDGSTISPMETPIVTRPFYFISAGNELIIQRYVQHAWRQILKYLYEKPQTSEFPFMPVLTTTRHILTPRTVAASYFTPGGVDIRPWADSVFNLHEKIDLHFWSLVRSHFRLKDFITTLDFDTQRKFWYFSLFTQGFFKDLADRLKYQERSQRLTNDSAVYLLDTMIALLWGGPLREKNMEGNRFLFKKVLDFIRIHPDGVSVPDLEGFKTFLTQGLGGSAATIEDINHWWEEFSKQYPEAVDDSQVAIGPPQLLELEPDSTQAVVRLAVPEGEGPNFVGDEFFAAKNLFQPSLQPWQGTKLKRAIWKGEYQGRLKIPGVPFFLVLPAMPDGEVITVVVENGEVKFFRPEVRSRPFLTLSLDELRKKEGGKGKEGDQEWHRVPNPEAKDVVITELANGEVIEREGFYLFSVGSDGLVKVPFQKEEYVWFQLLNWKGGPHDTVIVQVQDERENQKLLFYKGDYSAYLGTAAGNRRKGIFTSASPAEIKVLEPIRKTVKHYDPETLSRLVQLNQLARRLEPLMATGRGYKRIEIIGAPEPRVRLKGGTVIVSQHFLPKPDLSVPTPEDSVVTLLKDRLERQDPVYQVKKHLAAIAAISKLHPFAPEPEIAQQIKAASELERVRKVVDWSEGGRTEYWRDFEELQKTLQWLIVIRKIDQTRSHPPKVPNITIDFGEMKYSEDLRVRLVDLMRASLAGQIKTPFYFIRGKTVPPHQSLSSMMYNRKLIPGVGLGLATGRYFKFQDGNFVLEEDLKNTDSTPYVVIRPHRDKDVVLVFDSETGNLLDTDIQVKHGAALSNRDIAREELIQALQKAAQLNEARFNQLQTIVSKFLDYFKGDKSTEVIETQERVLGQLKLFLPRLLVASFGGIDSNLLEKINLAVIQLIFQDIKNHKDNWELQTSTLASKLFSFKKPADIIENIYLLLLDSNVPEEGPRADIEFENFLTQVLIPSISMVNVTESQTWSLLLSVLVTMRENLYVSLDALADLEEIADPQSGQLIDLARASELGIVQKKNGLPELTQQYFIKKYFENRKKEPVPPADDKTSQKKTKIHWSADERVRNASHIEAEGGVDIGASAFRLSYQGALPVTTKLRFDAGVTLGKVMEFPKFESYADIEDYPQLTLVSHDHRDHIGAVPKLSALLSHQVPIYMTAPSKALMKLQLLADLKEFPEQYSESEINRLLKRIHPLEVGEWYQVHDEMLIRLIPAGHLLGAVMIEVATPYWSHVYEGDISYNDQGLVPGLKEFPKDIRVTSVHAESTYGAKERLGENAEEKKMVEFALDIITKKTGSHYGKVLFPGLGNGRVQRALFVLMKYFYGPLEEFSEEQRPLVREIRSKHAEALDKLVIYIDGMAKLYTEEYAKWLPRLLDEKYGGKHVKFANEFLRRRIITKDDPAVILASSGNLEGNSTSAFYARAMLLNPHHGIGLINYLDPDGPAGRLKKYRRKFRGIIRAKLDSFALRGHISGAEQITLLEEMSRAGRNGDEKPGRLTVYVGHGDPEARKELIFAIKRIHPEWTVLELKVGEHFQGSIISEKTELENHQKWFADAQSKALPLPEVFWPPAKAERLKEYGEAQAAIKAGRKIPPEIRRSFLKKQEAKSGKPLTLEEATALLTEHFGKAGDISPRTLASDLRSIRAEVRSILNGFDPEKFFKEGYWIEFEDRPDSTSIVARVHRKDPGHFREPHTKGSFVIYPDQEDGKSKLDYIYPYLPPKEGWGRAFIALSLLMKYGHEPVRRKFKIIDTHSAIKNSLLQLEAFDISVSEPYLDPWLRQRYDLEGTIPFVKKELLDEWIALNRMNRRAEMREGEKVGINGYVSSVGQTGRGLPPVPTNQQLPSRRIQSSSPPGFFLGQIRMATKYSSTSPAEATSLIKRGSPEIQNVRRHAPKRISPQRKSEDENLSLGYVSNMREKVPERGRGVNIKINILNDKIEYANFRRSEAFEVGRAIGGVFDIDYPREVVIAMLRALRAAYRDFDEALVPLYLKEVVNTFRAKGISLESAKKEMGAEILIYDHWPTDSEVAALVFSLAMKPDSKAEIIVLSKEEKSVDSYLKRIQSVQDVNGQLIGNRVDLTHAPSAEALQKKLPSLINQLTAWLSPKVVARFGKQPEGNSFLVRNHIVVTMEERLASQLEIDQPEVFNHLYYGIKRVRYAKPELAFQYSALQSTALSLSEKDYERLSKFEQRILEDWGQGLFVSRYSGIETSWQEAWLVAEARILETFAQAA